MDMKLMLFVANILLSGTLVLAEDVETAWNDFKLKFEKTYESSEEENKRKEIFTENFNFIVNHNKLYAEGLTSYTMDVNEFTDKTKEENLEENINKFDEDEDIRAGVPIFVPNHKLDIPNKFDWRKKKGVTLVKNQGQCGSCWAFAAVGTLETHYFKKSGRLVSLSVQNLIDCSRPQGNKGCNGGKVTNSFTYIHENGINSNETYPYEAKNGVCRYKPSKNITSLKSFKRIKKGNEEHLKAAIATVGPVACYISIDDGFRYYRNGILYDPKCKQKNYLNHVVPFIGYGTENGTDYWLIKNSWGPKWGKNGFSKIARNRNNHCDVATFCVFPVMY